MARGPFASIAKALKFEMKPPGGERRTKSYRIDPDDEVDVYQPGGDNKTKRNESHASIRRRHGRRSPLKSTDGKTRGGSYDDTSNRYDVEKRMALHSVPGYSRASEAFELLLRNFSLKKKPPLIGFEAGSPSFDEKNCAALLAMLKADGFKLVMNEFSLPLRDCVLFDQTVWRGANGVVLITCQSGRDVGNTITVASHDRALIGRYLTWWQTKLIDEVDTTYAKVSGIFATQTGLEVKDFSASVGWPLDRTNYSSEVLSFYDKISSEFVSSTPSGRLAILDGKPGCGKTFLLRGLVQDLSERAHFIYLPASLVPSLDGPQMLSILDEMSRYGRYDPRSGRKVFIVEDADECLVARGADNISAIRSLLNFCDGFLGTMLDIRIVATTNSGFVGRTDKIDPALLRPGRLIARTTVPPLTSAEVNAWFSHHLGRTPDGLPATMTLAEAYAKARDLGWKPREAPISARESEGR